MTRMSTGAARAGATLLVNSGYEQRPACHLDRVRYERAERSRRPERDRAWFDSAVAPGLFAHEFSVSSTGEQRTPLPCMKVHRAFFELDHRRVRIQKVCTQDAVDSWSALLLEGGIAMSEIDDRCRSRARFKRGNGETGNLDHRAIERRSRAMSDFRNASGHVQSDAFC